MTKEGKFRRTSRTERIHILKLIKEGVSNEVIAQSYGIHNSTVWRIHKRYNETLSVEDSPRMYRKKKFHRGLSTTALESLS